MARKPKETTFTAPFLKRLSLLPEKMERSPDGANAVDYRETDHFKLYERFLRGPGVCSKYPGKGSRLIGQVHPTPFTTP